jgi:hypothetical protein
MTLLNAKNEINSWKELDKCLPGGTFDFVALFVMAVTALSECGIGRVTDIKEYILNKFMYYY